MSGSVRRANMELLRIVAMLMVVVMHYLANSIATVPEGSMRETDVLYIMLESLCIVAVNVYVLISGYFLSEAAFSWKRPLRVIGQTLFYTVLIPLVLALLSVLPFEEVLDRYHIWNSIFPVQSGHYWFVTAYVVLLLFSPLLNAAVRTLEKRQLLQVLGALLLFFCIGKSLSPLQFATDRYGYDFGWFLVLYLIGAYIRRYGAGRFQSARCGWALYLGSAAATAGAELLLTFLCKRGAGLAYYWSVPFHYNFLCNLTGALGLFFAFLHMDIKEGRAAGAIRLISPAVFGVYLIHGQADVAQRWFGWVNGLTGMLGELCTGSRAGFFWTETAKMPVRRFLLLMAAQVTMVFVACLAIDTARGLLFSGAARLLRRRKGE